MVCNRIDRRNCSVKKISLVATRLITFRSISMSSRNSNTDHAIKVHRIPQVLLLFLQVNQMHLISGNTSPAPRLGVIAVMMERNKYLKWNINFPSIISQWWLSGYFIVSILVHYTCSNCIIHQTKEKNWHKNKQLN